MEGRDTFIIEVLQLNNAPMTKRVWSVRWENNLLIKKKDGKFEIIKQVV